MPGRYTTVLCVDLKSGFLHQNRLDHPEYECECVLACFLFPA